jgi:hypothetical protein
MINQNIPYLQLPSLYDANGGNLLLGETFNGKKGPIGLVQVKLVFGFAGGGGERNISILKFRRIVLNFYS